MKIKQLAIPILLLWTLLTLGLAARTVLHSAENQRRIRNKTHTLEQLYTIQANHQQAQLDLQLLTRPTSAKNQPLTERFKTLNPPISATIDQHSEPPQPNAPSETKVHVEKITLTQLPDLLAIGTAASPRWFISACHILPVSEPAGAADITLDLISFAP